MAPALLLAIVLLHEPDVGPGGDSATSVAVVSDRSDSPAAVPYPDSSTRDLPDSAVHPLQHELMAMADGPRRSVLRLAIGDGAFDCEKVSDVAALASGIPAWRVACTGARAYIVEVDSRGRILLEPQVYHERSIVPPRQGVQDNAGPGPFPDPGRFDRAVPDPLR